MFENFSVDYFQGFGWKVEDVLYGPCMGNLRIMSRKGCKDVTVFCRLLWEARQQMKWNILRITSKMISLLYSCLTSCSRWVPWHLINFCFKFCITHYSKAPLIFLISFIMLSFSSWLERGWVAYILDFGCQVWGLCWPRNVAKLWN